MRCVPDRVHGFSERPHYEPAELDTMFEKIAGDFLRSHRGKMSIPLGTDDIKTLIERDADDLDQYADLSKFGASIEGMTEFIRGQKPRVYIAAELSESDTRQNRLRTTLTHEYGHVALHAYLFEFERSGRLNLGPNQKPNAIYCKRETIVGARASDWMEWQAGYACGALLMPKSFVQRLAGGFQREKNIYGPVLAGSEDGQALIGKVAAEFCVSRDAAHVRLSVLNFLGNPPATRSLFQ